MPKTSKNVSSERRFRLPEKLSKPSKPSRGKHGWVLSHYENRYQSVGSPESSKIVSSERPVAKNVEKRKLRASFSSSGRLSKPSKQTLREGPKRPEQAPSPKTIQNGPFGCVFLNGAGHATKRPKRPEQARARKLSKTDGLEVFLSMVPLAGWQLAAWLAGWLAGWQAGGLAGWL